MVNTGRILLVSTIIGAGLLGFGMLQLNVDLSAIGFSVLGVNQTITDLPMIQEDNVRLLGTKDFVSPDNVIEVSPRFATGVQFNLNNLTVITDFTMKLATQDPDVTVSGYIWWTDTNPPFRIQKSFETFNGTEIGTVINDVTFTFPQAVILRPTSACPDPTDMPSETVAQRTQIDLDCPTVLEQLDYAVGIRVDQNLAGSFTYGARGLEGTITPIQYTPVLDTLVTLTEEFFLKPQNGIIGIDIFHNADLANDLALEIGSFFLMEENQTATVEQMEEFEDVACIAIFPTPPECTNTNILDPLDCGLAEELVNNVCVCKEGFTKMPILIPTLSSIRIVDIRCVADTIEPTPFTPIPPPLQVPPRVDPIVFLGLGGVILVGSLIGIGVRTFRK